MSRFYVLVHGANCWLSLEGDSPVRFAFLQNHWVEAEDAVQARKLAVERVRTGTDWRELGLVNPPTSIRIRVKEVRTVESFDDIGANPSGFNFYRAPRWWEVWKAAWWLNLSPW